jgi:hypothetical protein
MLNIHNSPPNFLFFYLSQNPSYEDDEEEEAEENDDDMNYDSYGNEDEEEY